MKQNTCIFLCGYFLSYLLNNTNDIVLNISDHELKLINKERNLIEQSHLYNSIMQFEYPYYQMAIDENTENKSTFELILNKNESLKTQSLNFSFKYPINADDNNRENLPFLKFQNLSIINKPFGLIKINNLNGINLSIKSILQDLPENIPEIENQIKANLIVKATISTIPQIFSLKSVKYQYTCEKSFNINKIGHQQIIFPFSDFKLDLNYQPNIILTGQKKQSNQNLNKRNHKGYLHEFKLFFYIQPDKNLKNDYLKGAIYIKNPIIYSNQISIFFNTKNLIMGLILGFLFTLVYFILLYYDSLNKKMIKIKTIEDYIHKKEDEIKELEVAITKKVGIEKEIIKGVKGYYHWELKQQHESFFMGINKEDFFSNRFLDSIFFDDYKQKINSKTIIVIIDYDPENKSNHNYMFYYNPLSEHIKFPSINVTRKSYWFYLLAFLIQTPNGSLKMNKLAYDNIVFHENPADYANNKSKVIPCLRIPQNNNDLGIDNEKYLKLVERYDVKTIIDVSRKQKIQEITYSLNREINYTLFIHSKFIHHTAFQIKDSNIIEF